MSVGVLLGNFSHKDSTTPARATAGDSNKAVGGEAIPEPNHSRTISADQAKYYVGQKVTACGVVAEVYTFSHGIDLNFTRRFPKNVLSAVIWDADLGNVTFPSHSLMQYQGKYMCVKGIVSRYRHRYEIKVKSRNQLS